MTGSLSRMEPVIDAPGTTACPACGGSVPCRVEPEPGYTAASCPACGLSFSRPMRAADAAFYAASTDYDDKWEFDVVPERLVGLGRRGALLDLGCGDGRFLSRVAARFASAGLDFNPQAVGAARAVRGLEDVHVMALAEIERWAPKRRFDVVTAFHVLEHVEDPSGFLAHIARRLEPGGLLALSVPNPNRWALRWVREAWDYPPHHLTRWTVRALEALLERQGFHVAELRREPLRRWGQLRSACQDICWTLAVGPLSFGIGSRWASSHAEGEAGRSSVGALVRARLGRALARLKGKALESAAVALALVLYLPMRLARWEGKSLLVLASPGPGPATDGRAGRP